MIYYLTLLEGSVSKVLWQKFESIFNGKYDNEKNQNYPSKPNQKQKDDQHKTKEPLILWWYFNIKISIFIEKLFKWGMKVWFFIHFYCFVYSFFSGYEEMKRNGKSILM